MAKYKITTTDGTYVVTTEDAPVSKLKGAITGGMEAVKGSTDILTKPFKAGQEAMALSDKGYDMMGEAAAESLGAAGHPIIGGAVGGTIANANNIAQAAAGIKDAPAMAKAIKEVPGMVKGGVQALKAVGKRIVQGPATERLLSQRQALTKIPEQMAEKEATLAALKKSWGSKIEAAEGANGIGLSDTGLPEMPKDVKGFAESMQQFSNMTPAQLAEGIEPAGLQQLRKQAEMVLASNDLPGTYRAVVERGRANITQALEGQFPDVKEALGGWRQTADAMEALPQEAANKKAALRRAIMQLSEQSKGEKATRKVVGGLAGAGVLGEALRRLGVLGGR